MASLASAPAVLDRSRDLLDGLPPVPFQPSPAQLRLAEGLQLAGFDMDVTTLCRLSNVSRAAYYRWQRNPGYVRWLHQLAAEHLEASFPLLLLRMTNAALQGDKTSMRLLFPYLANAPRGRAECNTRVGFEESQQRVSRKCLAHPAACASTAEQENITLVGPLDQPQPEPGNVLVGPEQDAYRDFPSGERPHPAPVTHPRYTPLPDGALPPPRPPALSSALAAGLAEIAAFASDHGNGSR